jgi:alpha-beta hydrolase superfamily lysophospholipase
MSTPSAMPAERTGELRAADGVPLSFRAWDVAGARAAVLVSHGLGEHGGRYADVARDLAAHGVSTFAVDHRGHGRSGGPRAYAERFERLVDDFEAFRRAIVASLPDSLPVFLLGHSLGGLIAIRHLQTHPDAGWRGAVLSSPLLGVAVKAPWWKVAASGVLSRWLPSLAISNEIDPSELSRDARYVEAYRSDPLVHDKITGRLYTEFMAHVGRAHDEAGRLPRPLLFLVPGADGIVDEAAVLRFARALSGDVTIREYEGFRHEPHNELGRERVIEHLAAWIEARI